MNTTGRFTLYDILQVGTDATISEIKSAFRRLSLKHHPDKNDNSAESTARFKTIHNAYTVLSNPRARQEYDSCLDSGNAAAFSTHMSRSGRRVPAGLLSSNQADVVTLVLDHMNFVLWDIEELLHWPRKSGWPIGERSPQDYVLMMLTFLDKWVLDSAGYPDYFFEARKISPAARIGGSSQLPYSNSLLGHKPYTSIEDYFYDIRRRMDRFLSKAKLTDLLGPVGGTSLRLIDCIFEAHNYCVHYLGWIERTERGTFHVVPPFPHSRAAFEGDE